MFPIFKSPLYTRSPFYIRSPLYIRSPSPSSYSSCTNKFALHDYRPSLIAPLNFGLLDQFVLALWFPQKSQYFQGPYFHRVSLTFLFTDTYDLDNFSGNLDNSERSMDWINWIVGYFVLMHRNYVFVSTNGQLPNMIQQGGN